MAVPVGSVGSGSFKAGAPQPLFEGILFRVGPTRVFLYQPSKDGQRFLVNTASGAEAAAPPPITVVVNWQAGLKK
jgi:hypothetical protein